MCSNVRYRDCVNRQTVIERDQSAPKHNVVHVASQMIRVLPLAVSQKHQAMAIKELKVSPVVGVRFGDFFPSVNWEFAYAESSNLPRDAHLLHYGRRVHVRLIGATNSYNYHLLSHAEEGTVNISVLFSAITGSITAQSMQMMRQP